MVKVRRKRNGEFDGSIGDGHLHVPQPASQRKLLSELVREPEETMEVGVVYARFLAASPECRTVSRLSETYGLEREHTQNLLSDLKAEAAAYPDGTLPLVATGEFAHAHGSTPQINSGLSDEDRYALTQLEPRCAQQQLIAQVPGIVNLDPPGSQSSQYTIGEDGRPTEIYYASYGSNLYADRFNHYISGGTPTGSARTYEGARDTTPPKDDIPVALNGDVYYAGNSGVWTGGVAFLNPETSGKSLGRAYRISASQFDDVVAQENNDATGTHTVDLVDTLTNGRTVGKGIYGTLVHVGDHNGCPVVTFTSPYTAAQARTGVHTVTPEGGFARKSERPPHDPTSETKPDWDVYTNKPSMAYTAMITAGLQETHGLTRKQADTYFAGASS